MHRLDTEKQIFFYENEFYPLSNFSAFNLHWQGRRFDTAEHAYQWEKFNWDNEAARTAQHLISNAPSAHDAFKLAEKFADVAQPDWRAKRVNVMRAIIRQKVIEHEYVLRKLMETGNREIIEDSWRDDFWGWGSNMAGQNVLGMLWMELRAEIKCRK